MVPENPDTPLKPPEMMATVDGQPFRTLLGAERPVDLLSMGRFELNLWEDGFCTGYVQGIDKGRQDADDESQQLFQKATRIVQFMAGIDAYEDRAARAAGREVGSVTLAPIYLRDSDSQRWIIVTGKDVRDRLKAWDLPSVWSHTHRGCQIRSSREADLRARCDTHGVRLIDERGPA